ncbi:MAG: AAA family ATPase, partial [Eubacteriaceae bacterium]|nr:AAA family ATPase [Eubacteriaceae bacterium]
IFIDEIDAVGRQRGTGLGGGNDEREQTLNQLLVEMDGFNDHQGIIILAATNRVDILDPALLRPGRFDRQIVVHVPDVRGREEILKVHAKNKPLADDVDLNIIAKSTAGMTGADLANVMNEASLLAARERRKAITMHDIEESIMRVLAGPEKKSMLVTEDDKRITAYHEVGHAIVGTMLENCDPVHEISIIPRGTAAGVTISIPDNDNSHISRRKVLDEITMSLGGRASEEIMLDDICAGAVSDIERATKLARKMITEWGMSEKLGPINYGADSDDVFIGKDLMKSKGVSETTATEIDRETKAIIDSCYDRARQIVSENRDKVEIIVRELYRREVLSGDEFRILASGGTLPEPEQKSSGAKKDGDKKTEKAEEPKDASAEDKPAEADEAPGKASEGEGDGGSEE